MKAQRWRQVREILVNAIALPAAERPAYLDEHCATDEDLRHEVESLLRSHEQADSVFLGTPAADLKSVLSDSAGQSNRVGRRIGVYQLVQEIGHGGMGEVYRAVRADGQYEKEVAIKFVRGGFDRAVLDRFRHERQILASLDHPNIARLLDGGTTDEGIPYLVMELIEGVPIDQFCDSRELSIAERLRLFLQVCSAVQYAHQRLVIHRDIKPGNILVTHEGIPKLLDFGIAKILDSSGDTETTLAAPMTPEYASPEQIRREPITTATDVYSLGVALYRLLAGRSPYFLESTSTPLDLARSICEGVPDRPSAAKPANVQQKEVSRAKWRRQLKGDLDNIVLKALRKEPERRYASVERLAEDIRRHLQGLPVAVVPDSIAYRVNKFVHRHRVGTAATALILILVAGGVAAIVREARIAASNERRAEKRFNDVRQLADSLLFEVHDSIQNLPGSTAARKLIVQRSLEYLSRLAEDAGQDISVQQELGNAYERVGLVQGNPDGSNLGDIGGALDSFSKAMRIRENLVHGVAHPGSADLAALAASYREMCGMNARYLNRISTALDYCNKARNIAEGLTKADPDNRGYLEELAKIYEVTGGVYGEVSTVGNAGDYYAALDLHRKALALFERLAKLSPPDPELQRWQGKLSILTADDLFYTGSMPQALPLYEQAMQTFEQLARDSDNPIYAHSLAVSYQRMGDMLLIDGRYSESLPYYRKDLEVMKKAMAADPKNMVNRIDTAAARATYGHALWRVGRISDSLASLRQGLAEISASHQKDARTNGVKAALLGWMAGALEKRGDFDEALRNYLEGNATYRANCESDPTDSEDCLQMASTEDRIAGIYMRKGRVKEALAQYQVALAATQPISDSAKPNLEAIYTVVNLTYGIGEAYRAMAIESRQPAPLKREACVWYQKSRDAFSRISEWHPIAPTEFDARSGREIETRLRGCQSVRIPNTPRQVSTAAGNRRPSK